MEKIGQAIKEDTEKKKKRKRKERKGKGNKEVKRDEDMKERKIKK